MAGVATSCLIFVALPIESVLALTSRCPTRNSNAWPVRGTEPLNPAKRCSMQVYCSDWSLLDLASRQPLRSRSNAADKSTLWFKLAKSTAKGVTEMILDALRQHLQSATVTEPKILTGRVRRAECHYRGGPSRGSMSHSGKWSESAFGDSLLRLHLYTSVIVRSVSGITEYMSNIQTDLQRL